MTVILVGEHAPSESYVKSKIKSCESAGFESSLLRFPESITEPDLLAKIAGINGDPSTDGLILTNKHVASDTAATYTVTTSAGKSYKATVKAQDPKYSH